MVDASGFPASAVTMMMYYVVNGLELRNSVEDARPRRLICSGMSETEKIMNGHTTKRKREGAGDDRNGEFVVDVTEESSTCPYLDSVQRSLLDFDFEPACSVSLEAGPHIYGCLVCGKFFRGRGTSTPAYTHSVEESHFVFVHLLRGTFHCLPDDYEIRDPSLSDIKAALHPTFTPQEIATIDTKTDLSRDLYGRRYLPGFVGLNNLNKTDCMNAVVHALAHVPPLRDFFLAKRHDENLIHSSHRKSKAVGAALTSHQRLAQSVALSFGELVRKIWCPHRFKSHVDPHKFIQAVLVASKRKFQVGQQAEAGEFMAWLLHQLHVGTGGGKHGIVHKTFQGMVRVTTRQAKRKTLDGKREDLDDRGGSDAEEDEIHVVKESAPSMESSTVIEETSLDTQFLQLTLSIPEKPVFRDEDGGLVIPQEPYVNVLKKFDGVTFSDVMTRSGVAQRKLYTIQGLPDYLILHLARFKSNKYSREKNPAIVAFPIKNFDLSDYVHGGSSPKEAAPSIESIRNMSVSIKLVLRGSCICTFLTFLRRCQVKELKALLQQHGRADIAQSATEKIDLVEATIDFVSRSLPELIQHKYSLCANITHQSPADVGREGSFDPLQVGSYKCHVQHRGTQQWYEIQDLHVQEIMAQQIGLSESNLLIFERQKPIKLGEGPSPS